MNYVRKCLQKELIPVIQSPNSTTCPKVKDYAFRTHIDCWTKVPKPIPSFCELPINEVLDIVTTVDLRTMFTRHALTTGLGVLGACWNGLLKDIILGKGV
ncbi:hypothetical protein BKA69DRAFT_1086583 [Paraphysoderma sedebokerense]|nr:hypothetical protein BKA69DRAFT_1086583 [Paraphysoderma sedebokerense]